MESWNLYRNDLLSVFIKSTSYGHSVNCKSAIWTLTAGWDEVATFLLHDAVQMGKNKSIMSVTDMTDNIIKPSWLVSWTGLQGVSGIIVKLMLCSLIR